jgi:putative oxidoreductase
MADTFGTRGNDMALLLVRVSVGGLMIFHGIDKLRHGLGGIEGMLAAKGLPEFLAYGVPVGEILAPLLVLAGVFGRIGGLIMAFNMLMAIWLANGGDIFALGEQGGLKIELPLLYLCGALAVFFAGSGRYSLRRGDGRWD